MESKIRLRVPPRAHDVLVDLALLPVEQADALLLDLRSAQEPLTRPAMTGLFKAAGINDADEMVNALTGLEASRTAHDWTAAEIAEAISVATDLEVSDEARPVLAKRLESLLVCPSFSRAAKAEMLLTSHPRVLYSSRVLTDVRPVFDEDVQELPVGAIVSHQLELSVISADDPTVFYVALTDTEIEKLQAQLSRALEKARATREMLTQAKVPSHMGLGARD